MKDVGRSVSPPRDPGRLVEQRRAERRAAYRHHNEPSNRNNNLGFRCAELTTGPDGSLLNRPASCPSSWATANGFRRPAC